MSRCLPRVKRLHWVSTIRLSQPGKASGWRSWSRLRQAVRKDSWAASSARWKSPRVEKAQAKARSWKRRTISPKAWLFSARAARAAVALAIRIPISSTMVKSQPGVERLPTLASPHQRGRGRDISVGLGIGQGRAHRCQRTRGRLVSCRRRSSHASRRHATRRRRDGWWRARSASDSSTGGSRASWCRRSRRRIWISSMPWSAQVRRALLEVEGDLVGEGAEPQESPPRAGFVGGQGGRSTAARRDSPI